MVASELQLAEMLCTRLCHDLTGPIGAINNGAEFLEDEGFDMQSEAMQLVLTSASEAVHRLQFYRLAYGRLSDQSELCLAHQRQLVEEFFSATKIKVIWPQDHSEAAQMSVNHKLVRLALNLLIIASGALIKGGTIEVQLTQDKTTRKLSVSAAGDVVKLDPEWLRVLSGEAKLTQLSPKTAQLALTLSLAEQLDSTLGFQLKDGQFLATVQQVVQEEALASSYA